MKLSGITVAGNIIVDSNKYIDIYPEEGHLSYINDVSTSLGGCVPNTGIALKVMDPELHIIAMGTIGDDENGKFALQTFENLGIETKQIDILKDERTSHVDAFVNVENAKRTFFLQEGASRFFGQNTKPVLTKYLHVGYLLLLPYMDEIVEHGRTRMSYWLEQLSQDGVIISCDIVSEESTRYRKVISSSLPYINHLIINEIEASKLAEVEIFKNGVLQIDSLIQCAKVIKNMGVKEKIIIHSPNISIIYDGINVYRLNSLFLPKEAIVNSVGAGDAFCAASLYGLMHDMEPTEMLRLASCVAADVLMSPTPKPNLCKIKDFLELENKYGRK
ncbi:carbohydrate kinase family protein [Peloplasma aerotolerans]|uniref:Carbohydrate kinase family protein n=1 Tax=Peloplasma aerotolerans TaxID=3044389 RepID=A0AAW6U860_9MOLU|nr:carbohydrate kinase family protein [Mariniplasma sp. M4Ah]MDI6452819.1 carbohydrate kinase family protein [Mariniplasma sp. M4Ah]